MPDPISIAAGILTLFSVLRKLKEYKESCSNAHDVLLKLERDCQVTLDLILHAKRVLDRLELITDGYYTFNGDDIREKLRLSIAELQPELLSLIDEIGRLSAQPRTNLGLLKNMAKKALQMPTDKLAERRESILEKTQNFSQWRSALDTYVDSYLCTLPGLTLLPATSELP